jgi:hypothetical protein
MKSGEDEQVHGRSCTVLNDVQSLGQARQVEHRRLATAEHRFRVPVDSARVKEEPHPLLLDTDYPFRVVVCILSTHQIRKVAAHPRT